MRAWLFSFVVLLAMMQGVHAQPRVVGELPDQPFGNAHESWNPCHVQSMVMSDDGRWLVASYYVPARNRPGTDWAAWAVQWNLETGERIDMLTAGGKVAIRADGEHLIANIQDRKLLQRDWPLAMWRLGEAEPARVFDASERDEIEKERAAVADDAEADALHQKWFAAPLPRRFAHALDAKRHRYALADDRGVIRIIDTETQRVLKTLRLHEPRTFRVAAVQMHSKLGEVEANRAEAIRLIRRAALYGAQVVVLPEAAITGYLSDDLKTTWQIDNRPTSDGLTGRDPTAAAEPIPGESLRQFSALADELDIYLTLPLVEIDQKTGRFYNTACLLGPDGDLLIHYRKRNPWPWAERSWATIGDRGNPVVDTPLGRLSVLICYDIHEQAAIVSALKIDTLLYCVAWVEDADSQWFRKDLPAIARANDFNIIMANWSLAPDAGEVAWHGHGQTRIIDRAGDILARAGANKGSEIVLAELPLPGVAADER